MNKLADITDKLEPRTVKAVLACRDLLCSAYASLDPEIILYGSQVRGSADPESDIDLLILVNHPLSRDVKKAIYDDIYEIDLELDVIINPLIKTRRQWSQPVVKILPIYQNIQREGVRVA